jgi:hypothetical protein
MQKKATILRVDPFIDDKELPQVISMFLSHCEGPEKSTLASDEAKERDMAGQWIKF